MKKILIIGIFCLLSLALFAANPRSVVFPVTVDGVPIDGTEVISVEYWMLDTPGEVATWWVYMPPFNAVETDLFYFTTPWSIDDVLHCEVTVDGNMGFGEVVIPDLSGAPMFPPVTPTIAIVSGGPGTGTGTSTAGELVVIDVIPIDIAVSRVLVDPDVTFDPVSGPLQCDVVVAGEVQGGTPPPNPGNVKISYACTFTGTTAQQIDMILSYSGYGVALNYISWWDGSVWTRPDGWVFNAGLEEVSFSITPVTDRSGGKTDKGSKDGSRDGVFEFLLGEEDALPYVLSNFSTAIFENEFVEISWTTQSEVGMSLWNLYRQDPGSDEQMLIYSIPATNTTEPHEYIHNDTYVVNGETYDYYLESIEYDGTSQMYGPRSATMEGEEIPDLPGQTELIGNHPNPFNPDTFIVFNVKADETAILSIYNTKGQLVMKKTFEPGYYNYSWQADSYPSGVYFYRLETESHTSTKKMLLLK